LARLLEAQGGGIRKDPDFPKLAGFLRDSSALQRVRLNRRAYVLLNEPRLKIRYLANFYATYRLPQSPFFPLLLSIKWAHREKLSVAREERAKRIDEIMATYPRDILGLMRYLAEAERSRHPDCPIWEKRLRPRTKKGAREMAAFELAEWLPLLEGYIETLRASYRRLVLADTDRLFAYAFLECLPDPATGKLPTKAAVKAQFRKLSKTRHPDLGGDPRRFLLIKTARDLLLGQIGAKPSA
jgi:hypothetical protein